MLSHINSIEAQQRSRGTGRRAPQNLHNVLRDVRTILELPTQPTSAATAHPNLLLSDPRVFVALPRRLRGPKFRLLQSEVLQIFDHVPRDRDKLAMLLEDAEQRFSEEELDEMVRIIDDVLVKGEGLDEVSLPEERGGPADEGRAQFETEDGATGEEG